MNIRKFLLIATIFVNTSIIADSNAYRSNYPQGLAQGILEGLTQPFKVISAPTYATAEKTNDLLAQLSETTLIKTFYDQPLIIKTAFYFGAALSSFIISSALITFTEKKYPSLQHIALPWTFSMWYNIVRTTDAGLVTLIEPFLIKKLHEQNSRLKALNLLEQHVAVKTLFEGLFASRPTVEPIKDLSLALVGQSMFEGATHGAIMQPAKIVTYSTEKSFKFAYNFLKSLNDRAFTEHLNDQPISVQTAFHLGALASSVICSLWIQNKVTGSMNKLLMASPAELASLWNALQLLRITADVLIPESIDIKWNEMLSLMFIKQKLLAMKFIKEQ